MGGGGERGCDPRPSAPILRRGGTARDQQRERSQPGGAAGSECRRHRAARAGAGGDPHPPGGHGAGLDRRLPAVLARDRGRPRHHRGAGPADARPVHRRLCGDDAALRAARRSLRPPPGADRRPVPLRCRLHRLRAGAGHRLPARRPLRPGDRRLRRAGGGPRHRARPLPAARGRANPWHHGQRHGAGADRGPVHRRRAGGGLRLAGELLVPRRLRRPAAGSPGTAPRGDPGGAAPGRPPGACSPTTASSSPAAPFSASWRWWRWASAPCSPGSSTRRSW
jgi:hypothetical protein